MLCEKVVEEVGAGCHLSHSSIVYETLSATSSMVDQWVSRCWQASNTSKPTLHNRTSLHSNTSTQGLTVLYARLNSCPGMLFPFGTFRYHLEETTVHIWVKCNQTSILGISASGTFLTMQGNIANSITSNFSSECSSNIYDPHFRVIKDSTESAHLNFSSHVAKAYNSPFSMDELVVASQWSGNTPAGSDDHIHTLFSVIFHRQAGSFCCPCIMVYGQWPSAGCIEGSCGYINSETRERSLPR